MTVQIQNLYFFGNFVTRGGIKSRFLRDVICKRPLINSPPYRVLYTSINSRKEEKNINKFLKDEKSIFIHLKCQWDKWYSFLLYILDAIASSVFLLQYCFIFHYFVVLNLSIFYPHAEYPPFLVSHFFVIGSRGRKYCDLPSLATMYIKPLKGLPDIFKKIRGQSSENPSWWSA